MTIRPNISKLTPALCLEVQRLRQRAKSKPTMNFNHGRRLGLPDQMTPATQYSGNVESKLYV